MKVGEAQGGRAGAFWKWIGAMFSLVRRVEDRIRRGRLGGHRLTSPTTARTAHLSAFDAVDVTTWADQRTRTWHAYRWAPLVVFRLKSLNQWQAERLAAVSAPSREVRAMRTMRCGDAGRGKASRNVGAGTSTASGSSDRVKLGGSSNVSMRKIGPSDYTDL